VSLNIITAIFKPQRSIGPITTHVTIEENHVDDLVITKHPVEQGATITDHAFKMPPKLTIYCAWSNNGLAALVEQVGAFIERLVGGGEVGLGTFNESEAVYQQLLELQASRIPFDINTGKRNYKNMLISSIAVQTDQKTDRALFARLTCESIIIVQTQSVLVAPNADMKNPAKTAGTTNAGVKQCTPANPTGRGAAPPSGSATTKPWGTQDRIQSIIRASAGI